MENREWRIENGDWRMEIGEWRLENGDWGLEIGGLRGRAYNGGMARGITRRRFLKLMLGGTATAGLSALGGVGYATLVEPHWLAVERVDVPIPGLPASLDGFTIVQLSDLHRGPDVTQEDIAQAVELALRQEADRSAEPLPRAQAEGRSRRSLVVLTGDYVSVSAEYAPSCAESLSPLAASGNALACMGNHDHWTGAEAVAGALTDAGITVLRNAAREVADGLWVAAVDDVWERYADRSAELTAKPGEGVGGSAGRCHSRAPGPRARLRRRGGRQRAGEPATFGPFPRRAGAVTPRRTTGAALPGPQVPGGALPGGRHVALRQPGRGADQSGGALQLPAGGDGSEAAASGHSRSL